MKIKFAISFSMMVMAAMVTFGQTGFGTGGTGPGSPPFTLTLLPLPAQTMPTGTPGTVGTTTNFYSGYLGVTGYQTNVVNSTYSSAIGGFTQQTTNIVTNTATIYPSMYLPVSSVVNLEYRGEDSGGGVTNTVFTFANSTTGRNGMGSTSQQFTWTVSINQGTSPTVATESITNLYGTVYLISQTWNGTNTANGTLTNLDNGLYWAAEPLPGVTQ